MLHIALYQPEIPANTGNIIRLCANGGFALHLIYPLSFELDDAKMRRAGLDYHEWARVITHDTYEDFLAAIGERPLYPCTTKAKNCYADQRYNDESVFLFGPETRGLPSDILTTLSEETWLRIPMQAHSRSLNLSNATAIIVYEAWRQLQFKELK
jgi:tRNA (cytidine/uridine-2'-O-)-methyltransferase